MVVDKIRVRSFSEYIYLHDFPWTEVIRRSTDNTLSTQIDQIASELKDIQFKAETEDLKQFVNKDLSQTLDHSKGTGMKVSSEQSHHHVFGLMEYKLSI